MSDLSSGVEAGSTRTTVVRVTPILPSTLCSGWIPAASCSRVAAVLVKSGLVMVPPFNAIALACHEMPSASTSTSDEPPDTA